MTDTLGIWSIDPSYQGFAESLKNDYNETACEQDKSGVGYFEAFAATTGIVISLTNFIVVGVILSGGRKLRKATFYCICNLAVADMLAGLLLLWIFGLQRVALPFRTATSELIQKAFWAVTVWSSMLSQLVIAIDRYFKVTQGYGNGARNQGRRWGSLTRKKWVTIGMALTWLMPIFTFVVPVATNWNCLEGCACFVEKNSTSHVYYMICSPLDYCSLTNPPFSKGSMLYLGLSLLLMPAMPCILYAKIFHFVHASAKKLRTNHSRPSVATNHSSSDVDSQVHQSGGVQESHLCSSGRNVSDSNGSSAERLEGNQNPLATPSCQQLSPKRSKKEEQETSWRQRIRASICGIVKKSLDEEKSANHTRHHRKSLLPSSGTFSKIFKKDWSKRRRRDLRLLRTLMIILGLLLISTLPLGIIFTFSYNETDKRYVFPAKILLITSLINSMFNPWIYFWRFPEMRAAIKKKFCPSQQRNGGSFRGNRRESAPTRRHDDESGACNLGMTSENKHRYKTKGKYHIDNARCVTSSSNSAL